MGNAVDPTSAKVFFAYASQPSLRAETVRDAIKASVGRGIDAYGWEDLGVTGRIMIDAITEKIDASDACLAEISSNNPNVLLEAGYALAKGKRLFLAIDESDQEATRAWAGLSFVDTVGRLNYTGNSQVLATRLYEALSQDDEPLIHSLLASARPREENAVFAPGAPHKFNAAERLERLLERKTHLQLLASQDELGLGPLSFYVEEIYRSSANILHFMKPTRLRADVYNARLALLAGVAHGFELPLLMVAEPGYESPLDYKHLLYNYPSVAKLVEHVNGWLDTLPTRPGTNKRLGRLKLDIEIPIRSFGQYVAESEKDSLTDYFVHTNEFEAVLAGRATVFTGRKGTGKTASMQQAVVELRKDRRILVVPLKPSSYDLAALTSVLSRFEDTSKREYFLLNLWNYLLTSEVAMRALAHAEDMPAGIGGDASTAELAETAQQLDIDRDSDMSTRLDDAIVFAQQVASSGSGDLVSASETLRQRWQAQLLPKLRPVLGAYDRVAVLVDNLDKTWERGVDFENLSRFLLSLLVASGRLQSHFDKAKKGQPAANVSMTVFLRTDIYDVMTQYAREPDKINPQTIRWSDEELLIRVLEERFVANKDTKGGVTPESLWTDVFCAEVHSLPARDYLLWRALRRPRDIIFLGNSALTTAINRRHDKVLSQDFAHAEFMYSRFAVEALLVESEAQGFDLEEILFEFAGLDSTVSADDLAEVLSEVENAGALVDWLIRTSFLGLETRDGSFVHVEGESEVKKKSKAAARLADRLGRPLRYRVHPAFRPYLDVRDDDLMVHQEEAVETVAGVSH